MDVNRRFQAKWTKYKNRSISYNKNTINVQFQEDVKTIKQKLGVVRYDIIPNSTQRTAAILEIENTQ